MSLPGARPRLARTGRAGRSREHPPHIRSSAACPARSPPPAPRGWFVVPVGVLHVTSIEKCNKYYTKILYMKIGQVIVPWRLRWRRPSPTDPMAHSHQGRRTRRRTGQAAGTCFPPALAQRCALRVVVEEQAHAVEVIGSHWEPSGANNSVCLSEQEPLGAIGSTGSRLKLFKH